MITVEGLTKVYGNTVSVDNVSFQAKPGRVTGFLGPNGAGKSTCMRMMTGLTPPTRGHATILGKDYSKLDNPGRHVGVLLDASAQHAGRTGREVLTLGAKTMGLGTDRVDEILDVVGLTPAEAKRRVGDYSLGMRQRLGIGHALLGDPEVLILDEPANGLDPAGIRWMRGLLRSYAERGGTVLLSSHLLHEVEQIADDLVMIGRGRIVRQGTKQELLRGAGTNAASTDDAALASALEAAGIQVQRTQTGIHTTVEPIEVGRVAAQHGIVLVQLGAAGGSGLEEMFLNLTAADSREVAR
ncbi:ABC-2 type transport system ATP-binding protein [Dermacoccus sp. SAI-028]|uniref:ABC transporter ATP-binding protein n=1 Tax=Dermacoccus TaxID=57495 RepID=UPI001042A09E|nr:MULTISPECIES: ATP-binding cassette domain-containing protein [Dermacoccus]MCT1604632.1 ATP-binding cassette domain-containing protein [Dermacoccus nishinomiyaensis]TCJ90456.1 ABC-2 type transport system ATP-binding protein [Dermacoccus sp. SAI-028]